jgi:hypothetical protein
MTDETAVVHQPKHPTYALTTFELRDYRRELEHTLSVLPEHAAARQLLQEKLAEVLAEQESRARIATGRRVPQKMIPILTCTSKVHLQAQ